ncbi:DUF4306 domain-containing protein [Metabacillus sediminilitoris]|uniref:DUF4306 domain-containing protein n=1 Tax=Metabacillus sediminilitoris TaxID=2567941 RepID=A0A4V6RXG7_9BACI|nr:DUF4306 domain-containing protein [Metabacillus sediminilitoris]QGQ45895.1 DUF4306 domain-containing protein [Metabacillus sediminilitoris]THF75077.1 DUF4306 domain-containing protein [Metabacillus sediminilitoris]
MKRLIVFILLLPVCVFSFFSTSWTGSYMMIEEDWKEHIVFTPENSIKPQQIYEIDKYFYAFKYQPVISIVCILSFLILIGIIISWISKKLRINPKAM